MEVSHLKSRVGSNWLTKLVKVEQLGNFGNELDDSEYSLVDESIEKLKNLRTSIAENAPVSQRMEMRSLPVLNQVSNRAYSTQEPHHKP